MKKLVAPAFDRGAMERRSEAFRSTATRQLELLAERTLYDLRPRDRLFTLSAAAAALGRPREVRELLSTIARLAGLSLTAGDAATEVSATLSWPEPNRALTTRGPADAVGASDWLFGFSAAMTADDLEAERTLLQQRGRVRHAPGVSIDPYWAPLGDAWEQIAAGDIKAAGSHLTRALELADPEQTIMSPEYVLAVPVPAIEVMFQALERDQAAFTAAIEKGVGRLHELRGAYEELTLVPVYLLGAARLGLRRGLALELEGLQLAPLTAA